MEQGALADPRWTDDGHLLASINIEIDVVQDGHLDRAEEVRLGEVLGLEKRQEKS